MNFGLLVGVVTHGCYGNTKFGIVLLGEGLLQQPAAIADWSMAVADEEQQQDGYYTDSMLNNRQRRRQNQPGWGRGHRRPPSSLHGSHRDLGESLGKVWWGKSLYVTSIT